MASVQTQDLVDRFDEFYREYYEDEIAELALSYPSERRSLYVDWMELYRFDEDLADDFRTQPDRVREHAEEALRLFDLPVDVELDQAHVRVTHLPDTEDIREIRAEHANRLIAVRGIVRKATGVKPRIELAEFECQRCGTLTRIPQEGGTFQEPHQCQGCERKGPFKVNHEESTFVDAQKLRIQESPEGLRGGQTPESIDVDIEDDITGQVSPGDSVRATGVLRLKQESSGQETSTLFDFHLDGVAIHPEEEQFDEMDITEEDEREILQLSDEPDIYQRMVDSIAPSIYGYENAKMAMALQLFSGVTKRLPDGSRTRGDMHMLLIGDPGTGKCIRYSTRIRLANGTHRRIGEIVEENLSNPIEIDDGYYQGVDIKLLSIEGSQLRTRRATRVWKRKAPDRLYQIRTESGREIEITPTHPLFIQAHLSMAPKTAEALEQGDFIAVPRVLPAASHDTVDVSIDHSTRIDANAFSVPDYLTPELARYLGYVIADGHVQEQNNGVVVTSSDNEIVEDVASILREVGLRYRVYPHSTRRSSEIVYTSSADLVRFLRRVEPAILETSEYQRVPDLIQRASPENVRAFLKAYIEGESTVSAKQREISVSSMSRELLEGVRTLLLRFGIDSQLHSKAPHDSFRLRISGDDFDRYVEEIGFVTDRKTEAANAHEGTTGNTNRDVIPNIGSTLESIRTSLELSQFECGVPRSTYQHYERGDRNPSRESLRKVVTVFEKRLEELEALADRLEAERWHAVEDVRRELNISQAELSSAVDVTQTAISYYKRKEAVPDGGVVHGAIGVLAVRIHEALAVRPDVEALRDLVEADIGWDRIVEIEEIEPDDEWVYDLEVEGTHNYIANGIVSHNSQLLQYIRNIAPRSVYTSGKGSSAAGLCVTGDTLIHTSSGFKPIHDLVTSLIPEPTAEETAVDCEIPIQSYDRESGEMQSATASHAWRMPKKPCRRLETLNGKSLETSSQTPVLTCSSEGIEWKAISDVEEGDHVAVPAFESIPRQRVAVRDFLDLTTEKVKLSADSIGFVRNELTQAFGSLRDAAAELDLSEDFIYSHLRRRHVPIEKLDRILDGIGALRSDVSIESLMIRHGNCITLPETVDDDLMYLLGLTFGDGDISLNNRDENRGLVRISNSDTDLLSRAADIFEEKFDKRPEIEEQEDRVPCIRVHSATIARLFTNMGMSTPKADISLSPELTTAEHADTFIRGLMDADGSVSVRDNGGSSVVFSTISETLAQQLQLMLETYGVSAKIRDRDRRGVYTLENGQEIETKRIQYQLDIYGADIDRYASRIGFKCTEKAQALEKLRETDRLWEDQLPIGPALSNIGGPAGKYYVNIHRADNSGRSRAAAMLDDLDLGSVEQTVREAVEAELRWDKVVAVEDIGEKEVFDLTVPGLHNFVGNGIVTHNTAAAVRDEFAEGNQWTLEAGALVLADRGIAAIDELDKMRCVTGDTLVRLRDGETRPIAELARQSAETGDIEELANGRTIRGVDLDVWTMAEETNLAERPVSAIHEYDAPEQLVEVTLETGDTLRTTPDHPFIAWSEDGPVEIPAGELTGTEELCIPADRADDVTADGVKDEGASFAVAGRLKAVERPTITGDVAWCEIATMSVVDVDADAKVYDLTVEDTHNYVANGMVVHNSEDRSALHEGLEAQEISISKAGINATLKARCSLLGAANPQYGRFDPYEPVGEQIDLEPALISRFDLIFTITDQPDEEDDRNLAEHILDANYAGELQSRKERLNAPEVTDEEIDAVSREVEPAIDPELFRKYVAFAQQACFPRMTDEAREEIQNFYVDLRSRGTDEDAPVPVTARKLEALVRLSEASARVRLSDTVEREDAERVIEIVRTCLQDIGVDPETGQFDADVVETGQSKTQRQRVKSIKEIIREQQDEHEGGAPLEAVLGAAEEAGIEREKAEHQIQKLKDQGEVFTPEHDRLRLV